MPIFDVPDDQIDQDELRLLNRYLPGGGLFAGDDAANQQQPWSETIPGPSAMSNAGMVPAGMPTALQQKPQTKLDSLLGFFHKISPVLTGAGVGASVAPGPTRGLAAPGFGQQLFTGMGAATQYAQQQKLLQRRQALAEGLLRQRATEAQTRAQQQAATEQLRQQREERLLQQLTSRQPAQQTIQQLHAAAVQKALNEGRDPSQDPTVQQLEDSITRIQREPAQARAANETPFVVWRQQHPDADVSEYFRLQPEARSEFRAPKESSRLTAGQKMTAARNYKRALSDIEKERRAREGGTYLDPRTQEMLAPMTLDELNERKQAVEDEYKDSLEAGGEQNVRHYNYATNSYDEPTQPARAGGHKVGDVVTYQGNRYRIAGIKNGKAQLAPAQ